MAVAPRIPLRIALPVALLMAMLGGCTTAPQGQPGSASPAAPAASVAGPLLVAAAGDIACPASSRVTQSTCRQAATARLIGGSDADVVIPLGDTQYEKGALADYTSSYDPTWGRFLGRSYPVVGNHEYHNGDASGFFTYFRQRVPNPQGWYAADLNSWRLYVLNTNCDEVDCDEEQRWLRRDLAAHPRACSIAAMHHPRFSSGSVHGNSSDAARFWPTLDSHQVDVALAGHDHGYERFAPRHSSGGVAADGIRSFVVGTGGRGFYPFGTIQQASRAHVGRVMGALFLVLRDGRYTWRFQGIDGRVHDSGSATCVR